MYLTCIKQEKKRFDLKLKLFKLNNKKLERHIPKLIALIKIVEASMKIMIDALPRSAIIFLTTCCPANAAIVAIKEKYAAAEEVPINY